jgi:hypothetical protein
MAGFARPYMVSGIKSDVTRPELEATVTISTQRALCYPWSNGRCRFHHI